MPVTVDSTPSACQRALGTSVEERTIVEHRRIVLRSVGSLQGTASASATAAAAFVGAVFFEDEVRPQLQALHRRALRMTRNAEMAQDLVQDTLERAYRRFDNYELGTNLREWLSRTMLNLHIMAYRK